MKKESNALKHHYVSDIDRSLAKFDQSHELSTSQRAEIDKYKEIYHKRDHSVHPKQKKDIWDF